MKRKLKLNLSPSQTRLFLRIAVFLLVTLIAWFIFAPRYGVLASLQKSSRLRELEAKTNHLEESNRALAKEIERLKNDPAYLEEVARREHGLLKKNEYIYDFSEQKRQQ
jgi:cell division protein FtsB